MNQNRKEIPYHNNNNNNKPHYNNNKKKESYDESECGEDSEAEYDQIYSIPHTTLEQLKKDEEILKLLKSNRLQSLLKEIDSVENNLEMLEDNLTNNKDFSNFMALCMRRMGYFDEHNQFIDADAED